MILKQKKKTGKTGFQRCKINERIVSNFLVLHPKMLCNLLKKIMVKSGKKY